jgi:hypothetical protein
VKLDPKTNRPVRVGGIDFVVKNGVVYDGARLRQEIKAVVAAEKERLGVAPGPMPIVDVDLQRN